MKASRTRGSWNFGAADVEGERLHQAEIFDRKFFEQDALVGDRGEVIGGGPVLGDVLDAPVDRVRLERFERDGGVAEIFEVQLVEIVAADIDVELAAPIVLDALVDDVAAGGEFLDAVGAGAERRLERGCADVALACRCRRCLPTSASAARSVGRRSAAVRGCPGRRR